MLGSAMGFPVTLCMPSNVSPERKNILAAYGATIVWTDPADGSDGAIRKARELAAADPDKYFYADQYGNENNWLAHYHGTANEIWQQTEGRITHFVAGLGTSGTFMGTTRRLRELNPNIQCISMQPDSPFNGLEGLKHMATAIVPPIYDATLADRNIEMPTERAYLMAKRLGQNPGPPRRSLRSRSRSRLPRHSRSRSRRPPRSHHRNHPLRLRRQIPIRTLLDRTHRRRITSALTTDN
jgi:cysteine synthase B